MAIKSFSLEFKGYYTNKDDIDKKSGILAVYSCIHNPEEKTVSNIELIEIIESKNLQSEAHQKEWVDQVDKKDICFSYYLESNINNRKRIYDALVYKFISNNNFSFKYDKTKISISGKATFPEYEIEVDTTDDILLSKRKNDEINRLTINLEDLKSSLQESKNILSQFKKDVKNSENLTSQLSKNIDKSEKLINSFENKHKSINGFIYKLENYYNGYFSDIRKEISEPKTGLRATLNNSKKINESLKKSEKIILDSAKDLQRAISEFNRIKIDITDTNSSIIEKSKQFNQKINAFYDQIKIEDEKLNKWIIESQNNAKKIKAILRLTNSYKNASKNNSDEINTLLISAKANTKEILKHYKISTEALTAGKFDERKEELKIELRDWNKKVFKTMLSLIAIVALLIGYQIYSNGLSTPETAFYFRFLFASPLVFYLIFATSQYKSIRKSYDVYSFKSAVALSLEAHIEILNRNFNDPESKQSILNFSLDGLNKLYVEPYSSFSNKKEVNALESIEKSIKKTIETNIEKLDVNKLFHASKNGKNTHKNTEAE